MQKIARWTIALVCASSDDLLTTVFVHHRTNATPSVEFTLEASRSFRPQATREGHDKRRLSYLLRGITYSARSAAQRPAA